MKKIFTYCLSLSFIGLTFSQSYDEMASKALSALETPEAKRPMSMDLSVPPLNFLYDRVYPASGLDEFNQKKNVSYADHFLQAWDELYRAATNKDFPTADFIETQGQRQALDRKVVLGLIDVDFYRIKPTAAEEGLVKVENERLYHVKGKPSPFEALHSLVIAPLVAEIYTLEPTYVFDPDFILQDAPRKGDIAQLEADLGDGQWRVLIRNGQKQPLERSVRYESPGEKTLKFRAVWADGSRLDTSAKLLVYAAPDRASPMAKILSGEAPPEGVTTISASVPFQGYDEKSDCGGSCYGQGEYKIFLSDDGVFDKPVIILDGFDPGDKRKIDTGEKNIYEDQLFNKETKKKLGDQLKAQGYDVVILNFHVYPNGKKTRDGGSDYIERNAMVLVELIKEINRMKRGDEELVIIGPSMGGLISRYALAYMEKNNMPHHTRLWISFDTPHQGANIPIGMQHALRWFRLREMLSPINSPAAKQMLASHHLAGWDIPPTGAPGFFNRFMENLNELGYPKNLRKITISNGSMLGAQTNSPQGTFIRGLGSALLGTFRVRAGVSFTPESGLSTVFWVQKRLIFLIPLKGDYYKSISDPAVGSYDNAPGGMFDFYTAMGPSPKGTTELLKMKIKSSFWAKLLSFISQFSFSSFGNLEHARFFSFIPSKSSIDFKGRRRLLKENVSDRNMICSGETPFDTYYMPVENQGHVQLTRANTDFILNEINKNPQTPTSSLSPDAIQGQGLICDGSVQTFSLRSCERGQGATLEASPNLKVIARGPGSVTVQAGDQNGNGWIKALDRNGHFIDQKSIWMGKPRFHIELDPRYNYVYAYMRGVDTNIKDQFITSTEWKKEGSSGGGSFSGGGFSALADAASYSWRVWGTVSATNTCGSTERYFELTPWIPSNNCRYRSGEINDVYQTQLRRIQPRRYLPCPEYRSFSLKEAPSNRGIKEKDAQESALIQSYIVYDLLGLEVKRQLSPSAEIDLSGLPSGQYVVKYQIEGKWRSENRFVDDKGR